MGLKLKGSMPAPTNVGFSTPAIVTWVTSSLGPMFKNQTVSIQLNATVVPSSRVLNYYVSQGSLPSGLTLSSTGLISGSPVVFGSYSFGITVKDVSDLFGGVEQTFSGIIDLNDIFTFPTDTLSLVQGTSVSYNINGASVSGNSLTYSLSSGTLPAGLTLSSSGIISGTPTGSGSFDFIVSANDGISTGSFEFTGTITADSLVVISHGTNNIITQYDVITPITVSMVSSSGNPITYSATGLPTGLTIDSSSGTISGTPTVAGNFNTVVTGFDGFVSTTVNLTFTVSAATLAFTGVTNNSTYYICTAAYKTIQFIIGTPNVTMSITNVPPGLTQQVSNGTTYTSLILTGTPTTFGTYSSTITASKTGYSSVQLNTTFKITQYQNSGYSPNGVIADTISVPCQFYWNVDDSNPTPSLTVPYTNLDNLPVTGQIPNGPYVNNVTDLMPALYIYGPGNSVSSNNGMLTVKDQNNLSYNANISSIISSNTNTYTSPTMIGTYHTNFVYSGALTEVFQAYVQVWSGGLPAVSFSQQVYNWSVTYGSGATFYVNGLTVPSGSQVYWQVAPGLNIVGNGSNTATITVQVDWNTNDGPSAGPYPAFVTANVINPAFGSIYVSAIILIQW